MYIFCRQVFQVSWSLHSEPSLDALSLRSDVIRSIKILGFGCTELNGTGTRRCGKYCTGTPPVNCLSRGLLGILPLQGGRWKQRTLKFGFGPLCRAPGMYRAVWDGFNRPSDHINRLLLFGPRLAARNSLVLPPIPTPRHCPDRTELPSPAGNPRRGPCLGQCPGARVQGSGFVGPRCQD